MTKLLTISIIDVLEVFLSCPVFFLSISGYKKIFSRSANWGIRPDIKVNMLLEVLFEYFCWLSIVFDKVLDESCQYFLVHF